MDDYTLRHLATWLNQHVRPNERDAVESAILRLLADDPDLADRGWSEVRRLAECAYPA